MKLFASPKFEEWLIVFGLLIAITISLYIAEKLRLKNEKSPEVARKFVHISVGLLVFFSPVIFNSGIPPLLLGIIFISVNLFALLKGKLRGIHAARSSSFGTVFYPISFVILVLLFWDSAPFLISVPILILALGDAGAAVVGENLRNPKIYFLTSEKKSIEGSLAMFLISANLVFFGLQFSGFEITYSEKIFISIVAGFIATLLEAVSIRGLDNLIVPLGVAFVLHFYLYSSFPNKLINMSYGIILGGLISFVSSKLKFLTKSGVVATFLMAFTLYIIGEWKLVIPILLFFLLSSVVSKIGKKRKQEANLLFDKTSERDIGQVIANGGVATLIAILIYSTNNNNLYLLYLSSIAAVTADTWGTEFGLFSKSQPRLITNFKKVNTGLSGAISKIGIIAGIIGSFIIAFSGKIFQEISDYQIFVITFAGILASLVDSILGATIQAQYKCVECNKITERKSHCTLKTELISGFKFINNDFVNILCGFAGVLVSIVLLNY